MVKIHLIYSAVKIGFPTTGSCLTATLSTQLLLLMERLRKTYKYHSLNLITGKTSMDRLYLTTASGQPLTSPFNLTLSTCLTSFTLITSTILLARWTTLLKIKANASSHFNLIQIHFQISRPNNTLSKVSCYQYPKIPIANPTISHQSESNSHRPNNHGATHSSYDIAHLKPKSKFHPQIFLSQEQIWRLFPHPKTHTQHPRRPPLPPKTRRSSIGPRNSSQGNPNRERWVEDSSREIGSWGGGVERTVASLMSPGCVSLFSMYAGV